MKEQKQSKTVTVGRSLLLVLAAVVFGIGVFIGRGSSLLGPGSGDRPGVQLPDTEDFRYIRQSLQAETDDSRKIRELKPFRYKVNHLIEEKVEEEEAQFVAVYFRDLENGNWFGIRDNEPFSPESQLKLPLMIAYFKWAEANPLVLRKRLPAVLPADRPAPLYLRTSRPLEQGASYTVNELVRRMIIEGDPDAYTLLSANLPVKHEQRIYTDLYVNYDPRKKEDALSLSAYASFFRVLFNASYLSEEMSERALRNLARSSFRSGMAAGVPPGVIVARKAGERLLEPGDEETHAVVQLHEFGIVYHARRPFLLGITARGTDFDDLAGVVRDITQLIYEEVDRQSTD